AFAALSRAPRGAAHRDDLRRHALVDAAPTRLALPAPDPTRRAVAASPPRGLATSCERIGTGWTTCRSPSTPLSLMGIMLAATTVWAITFPRPNDWRLSIAQSPRHWGQRRSSASSVTSTSNSFVTNSDRAAAVLSDAGASAASAERQPRARLRDIDPQVATACESWLSLLFMRD